MTGGRVVPCGQTYRHDEANSRFSQFCERAHKTLYVQNTDNLLMLQQMAHKATTVFWKCKWPPNLSFWLEVGICASMGIKMLILLFFISKFRRVLNVFFWVTLQRLNFICRRFGTLCLFHLHRRVGMKMKQTECSETSAYKIQTPGNYPEERIIHFIGS
jgi:hypothetical protein